MSARSEKRKAAKKLRKEKREERRKSYTALDKQHIVYIAIMAVLSVILLAWSVPAYMGEAEEGTTKAPETSTTVQSTTQPTTAPSTTAPSVDSSTTKPSEQAKPDEPTKDSGKEETDKGESKEEILKKVELVNEYLIKNFRLAFGNRVLKQLNEFVSCFIACGGTELQAVDFIVAKKVLRKFESLSLGFMKDDLARFCIYLDRLFGKNTMVICKDYVELLRKNN